MKAINRYMFRQLVLATVFVAGVLTLLITLFGSLRLIDFIVNRGLPVTVLFEMSALNIPRFAVIVLPIAVFAAIIVVYNKLLNDSELVVMRATGMSQAALAAPAILLALVVTVIAYALQLYVAPVALHAFKMQQFEYRNAYGSVLLQEQKFNTPIEGVTVYIRDRAGQGELQGIFAHDARHPAKPTTYLAERGTASQSSDGTRIVMFNGSQQQLDKETGRLTIFYFDQYSLDLGLFNRTTESRWREPEERVIGNLFSPDDSLHDRAYHDQLIAEGHRRLTAPLYILAFAFVGVAALLSGEFNRRGQMWRILGAIGAIFALQIASLSLFNISRNSLGLIPATYALPVLAMVAAWVWMLRGPRRRGPALASDSVSTQGA